MMNPFLLCFFAICALFLINPMAGERYLMTDDILASLPEFIPIGHEKHPNRICQDISGDDEAHWFVLELTRDVPGVCSERIVCSAKDQGHRVLELLETPPEGAECRKPSDDMGYPKRYGCVNQTCHHYPDQSDYDYSDEAIDIR